MKMDGHIERQSNEQTEMDRLTDKRIDGQAKGQTDRRMDK